MSHLSQTVLTACVDGELTATEGERVEKHLRSCSRCQHELVLLGNVRARLRLLDPPTPPGDLARRLMLLGGLAGRSEDCSGSVRLGSSTPLGSGAARLGTGPGPVDADEKESL